MTFDEARCQEIEAAILAVIGVSWEQIAGKDRTQDISWARIVATGLLVERTTLGHTGVARRYNRDRSTMSQHQRRFRDLSQTEPYASQVAEIRRLITEGETTHGGRQAKTDA